MMHKLFVEQVGLLAKHRENLRCHNQLFLKVSLISWWKNHTTLISCDLLSGRFTLNHSGNLHIELKHHTSENIDL